MMKLEGSWNLATIDKGFANRIKTLLTDNTEVLLFTYTVTEEDISIIVDVCFVEARTDDNVSLVALSNEQISLVEDAIWHRLVYLEKKE